MTTVISGALLAEQLVDDVARDAQRFRRRYGRYPGLAVVQVGSTPTGDAFVRRKTRECLRANICSLEYNLSPSTSGRALLSLIRQLNEDRTIHGILIHRPLPVHIDAEPILTAIDPRKDVDGYYPWAYGDPSSHTQGLVPFIPRGCMQLIDHVADHLGGLHGLLIDDLGLVSRPLAMLLLSRGCNVTIAQSDMQGLRDVARKADIIVAASGKPSLVRGDWIKPGAIVIDAGATRVRTGPGGAGLSGDCAIGEMEHAAAVTPVPGGVGPVAMACLLLNTLEAARRAQDE